MESLLERFTRQAAQGPGCMLWMGRRNHKGYGHLSMRGKTKMAHRFAYETYVGPIPQGLEMDHLCRNRACVNASHLEAVTRGENVLRGETTSGRHARQTQCIHGHPFSFENTYIRHDTGGRQCKACRRERHRA